MKELIIQELTHFSCSSDPPLYRDQLLRDYATLLINIVLTGDTQLVETTKHILLSVIKG